jgi:DNA-binding CsgD family transcriptional regulator/tetratricopeptide (TPR) repeat protein
MDLLERDVVLQELGSALGTTQRGEGRVALISGEAGIGKTALVGEFAREHRESIRVLWGACDALFTPRPLGPVHDIAAQTQGELPALLTSSADRAAIFTAALSELQRRPLIVVFEDIHWADEATLDLLRFLGRRIQRTAALMVLTYRDDELNPGHPLRTLLGDLAASSASLRIALSPLTEHAVRILVGTRPIDAAALHRQTGGNPFFVTEVLSSTSAGLPLTIRDAVLGRVARLSSQAQTVLEAAAVVGPRIDPWLLGWMVPDEANFADECLAGGVLVTQGKLLAFRHELARQTLLESIPAVRRIRLHRLALEALKSRTNPDLNRLAHHAEGADEQEAILLYAPEAARQAAAAGAHRAAAALYGAALAAASNASREELSVLLDEHAAQCLHIADTAGAIASRRQAVELWRNSNNTLRYGDSLANLGAAYFVSGRREEAREASKASVELLSTLPPGRELALALTHEALLCQSSHDIAEAIAYAQRTIALAEQLDDKPLISRAYNMLGLSTMFVDYEAGRQHFDRAFAIASEHGLHTQTASAYANVGSVAAELFHLDDAEVDLGAGLAFTADLDLDRLRLYMLAWLAIVHLHRGRWFETFAAASEVLQSRATSSNSRWAALYALGRLTVRRGDSPNPTQLDEALELAELSGEIQLLGPVRAARAEAAWLTGDLALTRTEAEANYDLAVRKRHVWAAGELAFWRSRAGIPDDPPAWIARPYALQIAGDWPAAAEAWRALGCPYEEARALADGDVPAQTQALMTFDALEARAAASRIRRGLRESGVARLPRGPRSTTRANRFGLTTRQLQILELLGEGLSNPEIADRLSITPKTAEHHVAAILAKLEVTSRRAAVNLAQREQLTVEK